MAREALSGPKNLVERTRTLDRISSGDAAVVAILVEEWRETRQEAMSEIEGGELRFREVERVIAVLRRS
jgi:hypothetical protein